jgi:sugar lactone lactonase YvrE
MAVIPTPKPGELPGWLRLGDSQPPEIVGSVGTEGTQPGEVFLPFDVAVDSSGHIYIADSKGVQKFSSDGAYVLTPGGAEAPPAVSAVAVGPDDQVYIAAGQWILTYDSRGRPTGRLEGGLNNFTTPRDVFVASDGSLYVVDALSQARAGAVRPQIPFGTPPPGLGPPRAVWKLSAQGEVLMSVGDWGEGRGQFNNPNGVYVDAQGRISVTDEDDFLFHQFESDASYVGTFGRSHADENTWLVGGIAGDGGEQVFVTQSIAHRVQAFGAGQALYEFGTAGAGPGQFQRPRGLTVRDGLLYVADEGNHRVQIFRIGEGT